MSPMASVPFKGRKQSGVTDKLKAEPAGCMKWSSTHVLRPGLRLPPQGGRSESAVCLTHRVHQGKKMTLNRTAAFLALLALAAVATPGAADAAATVCAPKNRAAVVNTVQAAFDAMKAGDIAKTRTHLSPDFYIFDLGKRFDADGILNLIQQNEKSGVAYNWKVTEPKVHLLCDAAWITYVNRGSVTHAGITQPVTWLESGVLHYRKDHWMIEFMHSTRVPPPAG